MVDAGCIALHSFPGIFFVVGTRMFQTSMIVGVPNFSGALLLQGCTRWECSPDKGYQPRGSHFSWPTRPRGDEWGEGGKADQIGMPF
jgi:hypothetical protein